MRQYFSLDYRSGLRRDRVSAFHTVCPVSISSAGVSELNSLEDFPSNVGQLIINMVPFAHEIHKLYHKL